MMRRGRRRLTLVVVAATLLAAGVWLATSLPSAAARTDPHDAAATWSYLQAESAFFHAFIRNSPRGTVAAEELVDRLDAECPDVASGATSSKARESRAGTALIEETFDSIVLAWLGPDLPAYKSVVETFARLSWSNRRLTALVHRTARNTGALGDIGPADVCGDLKEWAAEGYTKIPPGTHRFLGEFGATQGSSYEGQIEAMLRPYEGPRARSLQRHIQLLRRRNDRIIVKGLGPTLRKAVSRLGFASVAPVAGQPAAITIPPPPSVVQSGGKRLSEFYEGRTVAARSGCLACHRIGEAGNPGPGPDLSHIGSTLTGNQIARALINPKAPMPSFRNLPRKKFNALVEFLSVLR